MSAQGHMWAVNLIARNAPGAKWVKLLKIGDTTFTVALRSGTRCQSDEEVHDKEAFLAGLHPDVWQARLMRADSDGETYHITFTRPRQMSF